MVIALSRVEIATLIFCLKAMKYPACRRLLFPLLHSEIGDVCPQASDEEEPEENTLLLLLHLRRISNDANLHSCDDLVTETYVHKL